MVERRLHRRPFAGAGQKPNQHRPSIEQRSARGEMSAVCAAILARHRRPGHDVHSVALQGGRLKEG